MGEPRRTAPILTSAQVAYQRSAAAPSALDALLAMPCGADALKSACHEYNLSEAALRYAFAFYHANRPVEASRYATADGSARAVDGPFDRNFHAYRDPNATGWDRPMPDFDGEEPAPPQEWCASLIDYVLTFHARNTDAAGKSTVAKPTRNRRTRAQIEREKRKAARAPARAADAARKRAAYEPRPKPTVLEIITRIEKSIATRERKLPALRALPWTEENLTEARRCAEGLFKQQQTLACLMLTASKRPNAGPDGRIPNPTPT